MEQNNNNINSAENKQISGPAAVIDTVVADEKQPVLEENKEKPGVYRWTNNITGSLH